MEQHDYIENGIVQLEQQFGLRITVIDRDGLFNYKQKSEVFRQTRHTHQTNSSCRFGFCEKCIANCRYRINQKFLYDPTPCYSVCWKGIGQIAVPLKHMQFCYGILYIGNFREPGFEIPKGLPAKFYKEYAALPEAHPDIIQKLIPMFDIFARGLMTYLKEENIVNDEYDFRIGKISQFLQINMSRNIGLPDIAEYLHLSESYTSFFIRQIFGQTFSHLLREIRIERIKNLLITTDDKLHTIAQQCGFSNEFHLSKVFKEVTGTSPSIFRMLHK